ncbi:hypothetical protein [Kribbella sp. NPDC004536]|uniref:hypothetical protein n=1 Tax=Kribbella sp. NPDC004536 TaxID=3364106 RepID=UPI00368882BA
MQALQVATSTPGQRAHVVLVVVLVLLGLAALVLAYALLEAAMEALQEYVGKHQSFYRRLSMILYLASVVTIVVGFIYAVPALWVGGGVAIVANLFLLSGAW